MILKNWRSADPFARVPKASLDDKRLSWKAKGILAYLLSKPDDWVVRRRDIMAHGKERDEAIREGFKELQAAGYAKLVHTNKGSEWHVYDVPQVAITASPENPQVAEIASPENPDGGFPLLSKKEPSKKEKHPQTPKGAEGMELLLPLWKNRLGAIFNRRASRPWDADEMKAFKKLCPIDENELFLIERYYAAERKKEKNICRTTLLRLMKYWPGEVDRANVWAKRRDFKRSRPAAPAPTGEKRATDEDFKRAGEVAKAEMDRLRAKLTPGANRDNGK